MTKFLELQRTLIVSLEADNSDLVDHLHITGGVYERQKEAHLET